MDRHLTSPGEKNIYISIIKMKINRTRRKRVPKRKTYAGAVNALDALHVHYHDDDRKNKKPT